jgi:hypothetical protein
VPAAWEPSDQVTAELCRVGVDYVYELDRVYVDGPPNEPPRRRWRGSEHELLERLGSLDDGAGVEACWAALDTARPQGKSPCFNRGAEIRTRDL